MEILVLSSPSEKSVSFAVKVTTFLLFADTFWIFVAKRQQIENHCFRYKERLYSARPNNNKIYGTEPRFNEILFTTNTIQTRKPNIYLDITDEWQHVTERIGKHECKAATKEDKIYVQSSKQFCLPIRVFLVP